MTDIDIPSPVGRVAFLLKKIWGGSQTRMARDVQISQSAISNVVTGRQQPGRKILAAIAAHPLVDATWLLTGEGSPLIQVSSADERTLFVAERLFEGLPEEHPDCLGAKYEVPQRHFRRSRYWIEIHQGHPLTRDSSLAVVTGDRVLFEADPAGWPVDIRGYPCIVRLGRGREQSLCFDVVDSVDSSGKFGLRELDHREESQPRKMQGRQLRGIVLGGSSTTVGSDKTSEQPPKPATPDNRVPRKAICAVAVYRCGGFGVPPSQP